jgi:hypothetical protein
MAIECLYYIDYFAMPFFAVSILRHDRHRRFLVGTGTSCSLVLGIYFWSI